MWLQASLFYSANIERIKNVVIDLKNDATSIVECKNILQKPKLTEELLYIETHFKFLPDTIKYFENENLPLSEAITKLNSTLTNLKSIDDHFGAQLTTKITSIFSKNPDLHILQQFVSQDLQNNVGPQ
jgi:predicted nuclease with TOPRIM domain